MHICVGPVIVTGGGVQFAATTTLENSDVPSATVVHEVSVKLVAVATIGSPTETDGALKIEVRPKALPATHAKPSQVWPSPEASAS
jgi:hypothetical protein